MRSTLLATFAIFSISFVAQAQLPAALTSDPPIDKVAPASMDAFQIPSHDGKLNAIAYIAAGTGPHPAVVLLHGFPGNEKNLDLAQAIRRDGWTVLCFNYRGSWGSPGTFSFAHAIEDTETAIAWLRIPSNARRLRVDTDRIVLAGHSMGGMISAVVGARDPKLVGVGLISAADMAGHLLPAARGGKTSASISSVAAKLAENGLYPLAGSTSEELARELLANAETWSISAQSTGLAAHPLLVVSSDDGLAPATEILVREVQRLPNAKSVTSQHFNTDHSYSDHRLALEAAFLNWLDTIARSSPPSL